MLVVIAGRLDRSAASLLRRWRDHQVHLLTCEALSTHGWRWQPGVPSEATLSVDGLTVSLDQIDGVVSLLGSVDPSELPHIADDEREYVAAEMMAFLVAWLSSPACPVLNRPTPLCLTGPRLHHEQWLQAAARSGLAVLPSNRRIPSLIEGGADAASLLSEAAVARPSYGAATTVSVVAGSVVSPARTPLPRQIDTGLRQLAGETGAGLLTASFLERDGELFFAGAVPSVDVGQAGVADRMLQQLGAVA